MSVEAGRTDGDRANATPRRKVRRCRALFILGSGFDPSESAEALAEEFRSGTEGLDFSKSRSIAVAGEAWPDGDRSGLEAAVHKVAGAWCRKHKVVFEEPRLLIRDYQDAAGQRYAVAAYVPPSKSKVTAATQSEPTPESGDASSPPVIEQTSPAADLASLGPADLASISVSEPEAAPPGMFKRGMAKVRILAGMPFVFIRKGCVWLGRQPAKGLAWLSQKPPKVRLLAKAGAAVVTIGVLLAIVIPFIPAGTSDDPELTGGTEQEGDETATTTTLPPVTFATGILRVYTPEEGFHVLIDGEPVRDAEGNLATTPCAVTARAGARNVTVFREGWFDVTRVAEVSEDSEVELTPQKDNIDAGSDVLKAPLLNAEIGVPIPLDGVNSARPEFDPYITPDGLSIWFAGDRSEGRGIFVATRLSPLHQFEDPQVVARDADIPGSPCVTDDALFVIYAIPEKARLMALSRENPLSDFLDKEAIRHSKSLAPSWTSAQMLGDGLRIYWVETAQGVTRTLASGRDNRDQPFGKTLRVSMPGIHPCLSRDGLRQYVFSDGKVTRYRRTVVTSKFIEDKVIGELELDNYVESPRHRQYFVSSDEQWLYYCDDPKSGGDLFMVKLSAGPQWGVLPRGKSIPPKTAVVMVEVPTEPDVPVETAPKPKPVDPRSLPLAYTSHWESFVSLMGIRNYEAAEGSLRNAKSNPAMQKFTAQLKWDEDDLQIVRAFWKKLEEALMKVERGDDLRLGTLRLQFIEYADGEIVGLRGTTRVTRKLFDLPPTEMTGLFDSVSEKDDVEAQYLFAVFLQYDGQAIERLRDQRRERAGELALGFAERLARRKLVQAQAEFDRDNFGRGVEFLTEVLALGRDTPVAPEAAAMEAKLYSFLKWDPRGGRKWQTSGNAFAAALERANGSLLVSGKQYGNFELTLEWMTVNAATAQGGVYFHYPGDGNLLDYAFKMQLANDYGVAADQYCTGSLLGESAPDENAVKPAGEWNTVLLRVVGDQMLVRINGRKVLETQLASETVPNRGYVCLDGGAGGITYRKILVTELPD